MMDSNKSQTYSPQIFDGDTSGGRSMAFRTVIKVPGKLMLAGEYAVLAGRPALATTLDQHLTVRACLSKTPGHSDLSHSDLVVTSDLWSAHDLALENEDQPVGSSPKRNLRDPREPFLGYRINPQTGLVCIRRGESPGIGNGDETQSQDKSLGNGVSEGIYDGLHFTPPASHRPLIQAVLEGARAFGIRSGSVHVSSELDTRHGFGSSSALYLGVLTALAFLKIPRESLESRDSHVPSGFSNLLKTLRLPHWFFGQESRGDLGDLIAKGAGPGAHLPQGANQLLWGVARLAFSLQWENQKRGSGYDTITQLLGGLVRCQPFSRSGVDEDSFVPSQQKNVSPSVLQETLLQWPHRVETLSQPNPSRLSQWVHLFVGGQGAPTGPLVRSTMSWIQDSEQKGFLRDLCGADEQVQKRAIDLFKAGSEGQGNLALDLMGAVGQHRALLKRMPQYPDSLAKNLEKISGCDRSWSFKTTGAGGEDALLVWGELGQLGEVSQCLRKLGWKRHNIGFDRFGTTVQIEKPSTQRPRATLARQTVEIQTPS